MNYIKIFLFIFLTVFPIFGMAEGEDKDQNTVRAEQMFAFLLQDQADSLYENLSEKVKPMVQKQQFKGLLKQIEPQMGAYQKHGPWEVQEMMGQKCYVSMVQFEKAELGAVVVFDEHLKILGIQLVPANAVKKE